MQIVKLDMKKKVFIIILYLNQQSNKKKTRQMFKAWILLKILPQMKQKEWQIL